MQSRNLKDCLFNVRFIPKTVFLMFVSSQLGKSNYSVCTENCIFFFLLTTVSFTIDCAVIIDVAATLLYRGQSAESLLFICLKVVLVILWTTVVWTARHHHCFSSFCCPPFLYCGVLWQLHWKLLTVKSCYGGHRFFPFPLKKNEAVKENKCEMIVQFVFMGLLFWHCLEPVFSCCYHVKWLSAVSSFAWPFPQTVLFQPVKNKEEDREIIQ